MAGTPIIALTSRYVKCDTSNAFLDVAPLPA